MAKRRCLNPKRPKQLCLATIKKKKDYDSAVVEKKKLKPKEEEEEEEEEEEKEEKKKKGFKKIPRSFQKRKSSPTP